MKNYVIGIDFGTLSGRCVVVDARDGRELGEAVLEYPHGVMDETLPSGKKLPPQFALQDPSDYLEVLRHTVSEAMKEAGVCPCDIAGMAIDFTACTLIPIFEDGRPLCFDKKFSDEPHAFVKLWKHSAAQKEADRINLVAKERREVWLDGIYGGKISSSWVLPKVCEILNKAPHVYEVTDRFIEAGDWLAFILTGEECHSAALAGYKALWNEQDGYPSNDFFIAVDSRLDGIVGTKLSEKIRSSGEVAGYISETGAKLTGLGVGTPVAVSMPDGHMAIPAAGVVDESEMAIVLGTSGCQFIHSKERKSVSGVCGCVKDAIVKGYYTYETGQICVGDGFDRFVKKFVPSSYEIEAKEKGMNIHKLLRTKAQKLRVGESGLIALDWFNGNRSILNDSELTGMIVGLTLSTKPEEIYRALIEATAFGVKTIIENFENNGIYVGNICASGGISRKDEMMMQIYADVSEREIRVASTSQGGALGSAMYAALAAGIYSDIGEAVSKMAGGSDKVYRPIPENSAVYRELYAEYKRLHDYFGRGENTIMKKLLKFST